jgi:hypothetical protein
VFDAGDNLIEVLGRVADLSVAHAAFEAAVAKYPDKRICLRQVCRVIRSSDIVDDGAQADTGPRVARLDHPREGPVSRPGRGGIERQEVACSSRSQFLPSENASIKCVIVSMLLLDPMMEETSHQPGATALGRNFMNKTLYIMIAAGLATLFPASQSLAQGGPQNSAQGGPSVTVVNPATNPVKTSSVDDPGRTPYQFSSSSLCSGTDCQVPTPPVPLNKRLVVQHVSAAGLLSSQGSFLQVAVFVDTRVISLFTPPSNPGGAAGEYAFDQLTLGFADAGSTVRVDAVTIGSFDRTSMFAVISGYLLDCTVNQCAPIAP